MTFAVAKSHKQKAELAERILNSAGPVSVELKEIKTITDEQMAAVHIWFRLLSKAFNEAGITIQQALEQRMDLEWDQDGKMFKELVWRPAMRTLKHKASTTELYKFETSDVIQIVERWVGKQGVHVDFPSKQKLETMSEYGGW